MSGIYVASRVVRAPMWKALRDTGIPITASWIDEAGEGETASFTELWIRLHGEINSSRGLIFYGSTEDAPWKGALVEVGIAIGLGKMVAAVVVGDLEGRTYRPIGSWLEHPSVVRFSKLEDAVRFFYADAFLNAAPVPKPCDHDWPDQPSMDSSRCAKCGMSFARHVFTECP